MSKDARNYWFFSVSVQLRGQKIIDLVFSFQLDDKSDCGISLVLGKHNESFTELSSEPIRLRRMLFKAESGKLVATDYQPCVKPCDYSRVANLLLAEVVLFFASDQ